MLKPIFLFFLAIAVAVMQVSLLPSFRVLSMINLVLITTAFILLFNYSLALKWAFMGGIVLDLNSALPFGVMTLALLLIVVGAEFLFKNFLTNRSFYSFSILAIGGILAYDLGLLALGWIFYLLGVSSLYVVPGKEYFVGLLFKIAVNFVFIYAAYLVLSKSRIMKEISRQY